jgi:urea transport system ATP-binding protein
MGHNGVGKTTLLPRWGCSGPQSGRILLDGEDITQMRPNERVKRGLGYVPQGQQCSPQLTTEENLQLVADTRRDGKKLIAEALDLFPP